MRKLKDNMRHTWDRRLFQCDNESAYTRSRVEYDWRDQGIDKLVFQPSNVPVTSKGIKFTCDTLNASTTHQTATDAELRKARGKCSCSMVKEDDPEPAGMNAIDFPLYRWAPGTWLP